MKIFSTTTAAAICYCLLMASTCHAFSAATSFTNIIVHRQQSSWRSCRSTAFRATTDTTVTSESSSSFVSDFTSDFGSALTPVDPLEALGIQEGQLALGVDPNDVYKYIGTYVNLAFFVAIFFLPTYVHSLCFLVEKI